MNYHHIKAASYIGKPLDNTVMYVSKKVEHLIKNLENHQGCLVFAEKNVIVDSDILKSNHFEFVDNPQEEYVKFVSRLAEARVELNKTRQYTKHEYDILIGENVSIGKNVTIEGHCLIDHDVIIGDNAVIKYGTVIRNAVIGDEFLCNEYANIGSNGFTMTRDKEGNLIRIPTLGKVEIGNNVEIGAFCNVSAGSAGNTIINDNVKVDTQVYIAHDVIIHKNCELTSGCSIGGFTEIGENTFIGLNASLKNRISIGSNTTIGMSSVVIKSFDSDVVLVGNPARIIKSKE